MVRKNRSTILKVIIAMKVFVKFFFKIGVFLKRQWNSLE